MCMLFSLKTKYLLFEFGKNYSLLAIAGSHLMHVSKILKTFFKIISADKQYLQFSQTNE